MTNKMLLASCAGIAAFAMSCSELAPQQHIARVTLIERSGGVYDIPVGVGNYCCFRFLLDTGASDVVVSPELFRAMVAEGYIRRGDMRGRQLYVTASGENIQAYTFRMPPMHVGGYSVHDAIASVSPTVSMDRMLLGQSFLSKLPPWSIDYSGHVLTFRYNHAPAAPRARIVGDEPIELCTPLGLVMNQGCIYLPGLLIEKATEK